MVSSDPWESNWMRKYSTAAAATSKIGVTSRNVRIGEYGVEQELR